MKKILSILLVMSMLLTGAAFAEEVASKTGEDLITIVCEVEGVVLGAVDTTSEKYETAVAVLETETAKLVESVSIEEYFGLDLKTLIGSETLTVNEMTTFDVAGYTADMGDVKLTMTFPTVYEDGEKVAVMIGLVDAEGVVTWTAFEGVGVNGAVEVTLTSEILEAIQSGVALLAIVSK